MKKLVLFFVCAASLVVRAESSSTSASVPVASTENSSSVGMPALLQNKKFQENDNITDAKMKADSGSLSKYSLSFTLSYAGPTIGDVSAADQPNPDGTNGTYETNLGGSFGGRYRLDSRSSFSIGSGVKAIHPFHGMERFDVNNPFISYSISEKLGDVQMRNTLGFSFITLKTYTKTGEVGGLNYDNSVVYNIGSTRLAVGFDTSFSYYFFNRGYEKQDNKTTPLYTISVYPNLKYNFTDKLSVNTSVSFSSYNPRNRFDQSILLNRTISERLGLGYAYTRDIYLSPYLNFYPSNFSDDGTTINFSTVFSVL